ncbi:hypothetical protein BJ956_001853 [Arthrobacter psychrochitiniphilus]|nr:hypothetical protein [Arthrobacter psychrochitiniphilus]
MSISPMLVWAVFICPEVIARSETFDHLVQARVGATVMWETPG